MRIVARYPDGTQSVFERGDDYLDELLSDIRVIFSMKQNNEILIKRNGFGLYEIKWNSVSYIIIPEGK